jgi:putative flippase GtrA
MLISLAALLLGGIVAYLAHRRWIFSSTAEKRLAVTFVIVCACLFFFGLGELLATLWKALGGRL